MWYLTTEYASVVLASTTFTVTAGETLAISPINGPGGTVVTLTGSGYAASTAYDFCYSTTAIACDDGSFTTTAAGAIPSGVTWTASGAADTYYLTTEYGGVLLGIR